MKVLYLLFLVLYFFQGTSGTGRCRRLNGVCRHTLCHHVETYVGRCHHGMGNCCLNDDDDRKLKV
ncbi:gallinacin-7-like [Chelonia mydas]|uniref:gallinacin-7-like n=1 Tax=Chelonia mydas TaxID=8469 RepID=UPI001CA99122|nr:gallinacin-7-like [Chelonia mydas]